MRLRLHIPLLSLIIPVILCGQNKPDSSSSIPIIKESPAEYPGGPQAIFKIISDNLNYPRKAFRKKIGGKVVVKFVVDTTGFITDKEIIKGLSEDIDREALRLVGLLGKWTPARLNDGKVRCFYSLPLYFYPNEEFKKRYKAEHGLK